MIAFKKEGKEKSSGSRILEPHPPSGHPPYCSVYMDPGVKPGRSLYMEIWGKERTAGFSARQAFNQYLKALAEKEEQPSKILPFDQAELSSDLQEIPPPPPYPPPSKRRSRSKKNSLDSSLVRSGSLSSSSSSSEEEDSSPSEPVAPKNMPSSIPPPPLPPRPLPQGSFSSSQLQPSYTPYRQASKKGSKNLLQQRGSLTEADNSSKKFQSQRPSNSS